MNSKLLHLCGILLVGIAIGVLLTVLVNIGLTKGEGTDVQGSPTSSSSGTPTDGVTQQVASGTGETRSSSRTGLTVDADDSLIALVSDDIDDRGQLIALTQTALSIQNEYGIESLAQIYDSIENPTVRDAVLSSVLHTAMQSGFRQTFEQAKSLSGDIRRWALHEIVQQWARSDPQATFETVWNLEPTDPSIRMLQRRAVWEWAKSDPKTALLEMDTIPDNVRDFATEKALFALARIAPWEATEYLAELSGSNREATLATEIVAHWTILNPEASIAWADEHSFSTEKLRRSVVSNAFQIYARDAPESALQAALRQPTHLIEGGMESVVIEEVAKQNSDLAVSMLSRVREDATTTFNAYLKVGREMARSHFEFDRAIDLGTKIPLWQDDYYVRLAMHWASFNPVDLLDRIEDFPSKHRSHVALCLVTYNTGSLVLSSLQVEQAKGYLSEEHLERVRSLPTQYVNSARVSTVQQRPAHEDQD